MPEASRFAARAFWPKLQLLVSYRPLAHHAAYRCCIETWKRSNCRRPNERSAEASSTEADSIWRAKRTPLLAA